MNEKPVTMDMVGNSTVDKVGKKTTGHEKYRYTVALACMVDGQKLKSMLIFKRKTLPKLKWALTEKCRISNAMDSAEDNIIWEHNLKDKDDGVDDLTTDDEPYEDQIPLADWEELFNDQHFREE